MIPGPKRQLNLSGITFARKIPYVGLMVGVDVLLGVGVSVKVEVDVEVKVGVSLGV